MRRSPRKSTNSRGIREPGKVWSGCMILDQATRLLRLLPAETAHCATIALSGAGASLLPKAAADDPRLAISALGLSFPNPVGLAAGFDKNAQVPDAMARLGFGFVECGTVTPLPQSGNP